LALFLAQKSIWAGLASVVVGWQLSRSRGAADFALNRYDAVTSSALFRTFGAVDSFRMVPSIGALGSAVCAQGGVFTALLDRPIAAATFLGIGSALVAWCANKFGVASERQPGNSLAYARRAPLLFALAIAFTLAGLMQYLRAGGDGDEVAGSRRRAERMKESDRGTTSPLDENFPGVILLPETAPQAVLVPPPPSMKHGLFTESQSRPLSIPFFGVYWLFRRPQLQPPRDSHIARGTPLTSGFRSSDRRTLEMEARQNFGTLIDLSCCSQIQLAISSADEFVTLELILRNTTLPGSSTLSLGKASIASTVDRRPDNHRPPSREVLSFNVPRSREVQEFDEATIVFRRPIVPHRTFAGDRSARVSIDRFIFVPRGL
jgi:hypothetical protein